VRAAFPARVVRYSPASSIILFTAKVHRAIASRATWSKIFLKILRLMERAITSEATHAVTPMDEADRDNANTACRAWPDESRRHQMSSLNPVRHPDNSWSL